MAADDGLSAEDRDLLARTVVGEAGDQSPEGQQAVAAVVLNRLKAGTFGGSVRDVLFAPNQFEPWDTKAADLLRISPNSAAYQSAAKAVDAASSGNDPTGGATYFLNPDLVKARGDTMPAWATGQGQRIGAHTFFGGRPMPASASEQSDDDFLKEWGIGAAPPGAAPSSASAAAATQPGPSVQSDQDFMSEWGMAPTSSTGKATTPTQQAASPSTSDIAHDDPGWLGKIARFGAGAWRGVGNVGDTVTQGINTGLTFGANKLLDAGAISPEIASNVNALVDRANRNMAADRTWYNQNYGNSAAAKYGEVAGEIAGTVPLMMGGEGVIGAAGEAAASAAPFLETAANAMRGNKLLSMLGVGARGAVEGAGANALTHSASNQSLLDDLKSGAELGAAGGVALRGAGNLLLSRGGINQNVAQLAAAARDKFGINIRPGQISSAPAMNFLDSVVNKLPMSGGAAANDAQQAAFNRAVSNTFGEDADRITPDVMDAARKRLGQTFQSVANRVPNIPLDQSLINDLVSTGRDAQQVLQPQELAPLKGQLINIANAYGKNGGITGDQYLALTRTNAPLDRLMRDDNANISFYARQIREALDDSMQRGATPDVASDLATARAQYHALKTVEQVAAKATTGDVSPALLLGAVRNNYGNVAYGGGGDLAELGRIGQRFLKPPPSSGTAERSGIMNLLARAKEPLAALAGVGGAAAGAATMGVSPFVTGGAYAAGVPLLGALSRSKVLANRMIESGLRGGGPSTANKLLGRSGAPAAALVGNRLLAPQYRTSAPLDITVDDYNHGGQ
jgi:hypothetical protein